MYFIAAGEVEIELGPKPRRVGAGEFFGEIALLTGAARTATVIANRACTLLRLDIADFSRTDGPTARSRGAIYDAVHQRLDAVGTEPTHEREAAWEFGISA
jgi:CRP-like cAMP-binding protein